MMMRFARSLLWFDQDHAGFISCKQIPGTINLIRKAMRTDEMFESGMYVGLRRSAGKGKEETNWHATLPWQPRPLHMASLFSCPPTKFAPTHP